MKKSEVIEELISKVRAKAETLTVKQLKELIKKNGVMEW